MENEKYKVRGWVKGKLLVYPQFQINFVLLIFGAVLLGLGIFYLAELYFLREMIEAGKELGLPPHHAYFKLLGQQRVLWTKIIFFSGGILLIYLIIFSFILSDKVAGPLIKLRSHIEDMKDNKEVSKIQFRRGDFFRDIEKTFNESIGGEE